ncbi:fimbrial protein [Pasteurellaceae bacterium Orientalotternb1]|nr:fimbrial protein [Pasteurellaceae bacterium Orientalotternb1]
MFNLTTKAYIALTESIRNFRKDEKGVTAIEYGLIAIAMAALIVLVFFGDNSFIGALKSKFSSLKSTITSASVSL